MTGSDEVAILSRESIAGQLEQFGVEISASMADQIATYVDLLLRWNQKVSLTTVIDPLQVVERHFGESLFGAGAIKIESGDLLDIGSGAGFPALPIAMICPSLRETLIEANGKKAVFLSEVCRKIKLQGRVKVVRCRIEEFSAEMPFDFVTSRAVRVNGRLLEQCAGLLKPGGRLVLWLGQEQADMVAQEAGWDWNRPIPIPGSERRYVMSGSPKTL